MQVFCPYKEPIKTAKCLDKFRLEKQIIECCEIIKSFTLGNTPIHPIGKMYNECTNNRLYLINYKKCLDFYFHGNEKKAKAYNDIAMLTLPDFMTDEFCIQHRRRLYTKDPKKYRRFAEYGTSDENWYVINGELIKYVNGKRL